MNGLGLTYLFLSFTAISWQDEDEDAKSRKAQFILVAEHFRFEGDAIFAKVIDSLALCSHFCLDHYECNRINYHLEKSVCEILHVDPCEFDEGDLIPAFGWMHYEGLSSKEIDANPSACRSQDGLEDCSPQQVCTAIVSSPSEFRCRDLENIAFEKNTSQSSTCYEGSSWRAVDGWSGMHFENGSCTHTCSKGREWWMVDFGATAKVYSVKITNREDCCSARLSNFTIRIGENGKDNIDANEACATNQDATEELNKFILCRPVLQGRYLYVQQNIDHALTLCEVEAFGEFVCK